MVVVVVDEYSPPHPAATVHSSALESTFELLASLYDELSILSHRSFLSSSSAGTLEVNCSNAGDFTH